jgi:hypothetical protein
MNVGESPQSPFSSLLPKVLENDVWPKLRYLPKETEEPEYVQLLVHDP